METLRIARTIDHAPTFDDADTRVFGDSGPRARDACDPPRKSLPLDAVVVENKLLGPLPTDRALRQLRFADEHSLDPVLVALYSVAAIALLLIGIVVRTAWLILTS